MLTSGLRRPLGHLLVSISLVALRGGLCLPSPYQGLFCQKGEQKIGSRFGAEGHQTPVDGIVGGGGSELCLAVLELAEISPEQGSFCLGV